MNENDQLNNPNPSISNEFAIDDVITVYPNSDNFGDLDCPPCTFTPNDCCGSDISPIINNACEIFGKEDVEVTLDCQGRVLTIRVILKCVCPNKKIAVGVLLFEGTTIKGFKVKEIVTPPLPTGCPGNPCGNVITCKFCFVLTGSLCHPLTLKSKVIAHYTDFDYPQCSPPPANS